MQIHGNSVQGRILHGNSPCELIEHFTETIGRPPELPDWIVSGAVAGMQGGTDAVRRVWDALRSYQVPVSAFWLQVQLHKLTNIFLQNVNFKVAPYSTRFQLVHWYQTFSSLIDTFQNIDIL